jgi:hypothetical protein
MTTTETGHKHMFPLEKPGVFGKTGPCECGLTHEQALAGDRIREQGQAAQSAFYAHFGTDADNGVAEIDEQHRPAWEAAARAVAGPLERERNILRGQLECAELTIADNRNALTALRAAFDLDAVAARSLLDTLRAALSTLTDRAEASRAITEDEAGEYRKIGAESPQAGIAAGRIYDLLARLRSTQAERDRLRALLNEAPQSVRADEFARVKVRLCALVASLDETAERGGCPAGEFDQGAGHASAVTARQLRAILDETAMGTTPLPAPGDPDCTAGTPVPAVTADEQGVVTETGGGSAPAGHVHRFLPGASTCECGKTYADAQVDESLARYIATRTGNWLTASEVQRHVRVGHARAVLLLDGLAEAAVLVPRDDKGRYVVPYVPATAVSTEGKTSGA